MFIHPSDVLAKPTETWLSSTHRSRQFHVCLFLNSLINVFRANITERENEESGTHSRLLTVH